MPSCLPSSELSAELPSCRVVFPVAELSAELPAESSCQLDMEKKVCICLLPIIGSYYGLQDLTVELKSDLDPGIRITFASDHEIHNCLLLPSVTTIHAVGLPNLAPGEK